jgi:hypothetical protein
MNFYRTLILFLLTLGYILGTSIPVFSEAGDRVDFIPPDEAIGELRLGSRSRCSCIRYAASLPHLTSIIPKLYNFSRQELKNETIKNCVDVTKCRGGRNTIPIDHNRRGGLTSSPFPSIFVYVPKNNALIGDFLVVEHLENGRTKELYYSKLSLPVASGIIRLSMPIALEEGKTYEWHLSLICDPNDHSGSEFTSGLVKRVSLSPQFQSQIDRASLTTQLELYGEAGLWYDFFTLLAENRQRSHFFRETWKIVLQREFSQDSRIHRAAFLPCCSTITREE